MGFVTEIFLNLQFPDHLTPLINRIYTRRYIDKSAAVIESIVRNHPFIDGNKRTGYTLMRLLLLSDGFNIKATEDEKYDFVIKIANGELTFEQIKNWIVVTSSNEAADNNS